MGVTIEWTDKFKELWKNTWNKILYEQETPQRIEIIKEAEELPSPIPRLSKNDVLLDDIDNEIEKHYPNSIMVGVTDTNSMEPLVDFGHQIVLIPFKNDEEKSKIQVGDVIWFHRMSDGSPNVLHRVIEKHDGWVMTRGDNLVANDGPTIYANIKGYLAMVIY